MECEYIFYMIYDKEKKDILYIGQTKDFKERKRRHKINGYLNETNDIKEIDCKICNSKDAKSIEKAWISHFSPKWNKVMPTNKKAYKLTTKEILKARGFSDEDIEKVL